MFKFFNTFFILVQVHYLKTFFFVYDLHALFFLKESSGIKINDNDGLDHKQVDLDKIFKPATDSGEVTPSKNSNFFIFCFVSF